MDLTERIRRRMRQRGTDRSIVLDYEPISPVAHVDEPIGRGPILERVLDHIDPVYDGAVPGDAYLWGPPGGGKTAMVTSLFERFEALAIQTHSGIKTTTRAKRFDVPRFVYADGRVATSRFQLYQSVLDDLCETDVPSQGVSTEELQTRLNRKLSVESGAVVAVDHVDEGQSQSLDGIISALSDLDGEISIFLIGRTPPSDIGLEVDNEIEVPVYSQQVLIDILMTRGSSALSKDVLQHAQARDIASWAGGNAHDALAALFGAAILAEYEGSERIREDHVRRGTDAVPRPHVTSLGVVMALPESRQRVLREFLDLDEEARSTITATTEAITESISNELEVGTVKRFLYELAEQNVFNRVACEQPSGYGRPPSRLEPRFPTLVFRKLYDFRHGYQ